MLQSVICLILFPLFSSFLDNEMVPYSPSKVIRILKKNYKLMDVNIFDESHSTAIIIIIEVQIILSLSSGSLFKFTPKAS